MPKGNWMFTCNKTEGYLKCHISLLLIEIIQKHMIMRVSNAY